MLDTTRTEVHESWYRGRHARMQAEIMEALQSIINEDRDNNIVDAEFEEVNDYWLPGGGPLTAEQQSRVDASVAERKEKKLLEYKE